MKTNEAGFNYTSTANQASLPSRDPLLVLILGSVIGLALLVIVTEIVWGPAPVIAVLPWFNPLAFVFISLTSAGVAFLALGRYQILHDSFSYWIGIGFTMNSLASVFYILAWPGLLPDRQSLIAQLPGTAEFIAALSSSLLVMFILAALAAHWPERQALVKWRWLWSLIAWFGGSLLVFSLIVIFEQHLPIMVRADGTFTLTLFGWNAINIALLAMGSILATRYFLRTRDALAAFVVLPQLALIFASLVPIIGGERYDMWWYQSRVVMILGYLIVSFGLLADHLRLFRREMDGRLMLEAILADIPIGLVITGGPPDFAIQKISRRGLEMNLHSQEGSFGGAGEQPENTWKIYLPDGVTPAQPEQMPLYQASHSGEEVHNTELMVEVSDGRKIPILVSAGPVLDPQGCIVAAIGTWQDITERKRMEQQLREANEHLEKRVHDRTVELEHSTSELERSSKKLAESNEELQSTIEELEVAEEELRNQNEELAKVLEVEKSLRNQLIQAEKYAALARLVGSVAHEINNPLQTIKNSLFLLKDEISSNQAQELLEMATSETKRMSSLVEQLRETYRPGNLQKVDFNLIDVLVNIHNLLTPQLKQANIEWHLECRDVPIILHGIPDQIKQVFLNICLNAIDAMGTKRGRLVVSVYQHDQNVCIAFKDTGPGIPLENLNTLFEPFFTTKEKGTGLGLAISYEIVKNHGGDIKAASLPGQGATFTVCLPMKV